MIVSMKVDFYVYKAPVASSGIFGLHEHSITSDFGILLAVSFVMRLMNMKRILKT